MKYNTQNAKIKSITENTLIVGIDVGSETHFARAFDWRNYEYSKKPLEFSNNEAGFMIFKAWVGNIAEKHGKDVMIPGITTSFPCFSAIFSIHAFNVSKPASLLLNSNGFFEYS